MCKASWLSRDFGDDGSRGDLVERHAEPVVQDEGHPLSWSQRVRYEQQGQAHCVGDHGFVLGICFVGGLQERDPS